MARAPKPQSLTEASARGQQPLHQQQITRQRDRTLYRLPAAFKRRPLYEAAVLAKGFAPGSEDSENEKAKIDPIAQTLSTKSEKPTLRILCMGGSQFPLGWSFVSIAKLPMNWNPEDLWTTEVSLPLGMRLEYKYVILEEQVWTKQQDEDAEGVVEVTYRTKNAPGQPPDVQKIRKQMAIVDWQPGPNRVIQVPDQDEIDRLVPGEGIQRTPARPRSYFSFRKLDNYRQKGSRDGTWEELTLDEKGDPVLKRCDIWPNRGTSLSFEDARRFFLGE